jgi:DNA-binding Lrp family transcriptional regulator
MTRKNDDVMSKIYHHLKKHGPCTASELAFKLDIERSNLKNSLRSMKQSNTKHKQLVYVCDYTSHDESGGRTYPRAVYALGSKPDAVKPKPISMAEKKRRSRQAKKRINFNSVFNIANTKYQGRSYSCGI